MALLVFFETFNFFENHLLNLMNFYTKSVQGGIELDENQHQIIQQIYHHALVAINGKSIIELVKGTTGKATTF